MIQNSNEFLSAVLDSISDGVAACNKDGFLTLFNPALRDLHGLPVQLIPAKDWANHYHLYHEDGITLMHAEEIPLMRALRGETVRDIPMVIKHVTGKVKHTLATGCVLKNKKGAVLGAVVSMKDITEAYEHRTQLKQQNEVLKKTNEELDRFVYSTSHELRSPLASILGLVELLKADEIDDSKLNLLGMIDKSVNRLDHFIEEINDYARNSRLDLIREEIDFKLIIAHLVLQLNYMKNADKIKLYNDVEKDFPFYGDPKRFYVIFNNFISNAVKYYNPNQKKPFIDIKIKQNETAVDIVIKDNGIGIEESHLSQIFKMFYRATSLSGGTGLGLFVVKETIDKMNGSLNVQSTIGEGTTFTLRIPNDF